MKRLRDKIAKVAQTDLPVLILGETGTGKELVAQSIHRQSPRAARPFICVNSGAIATHLAESELFGHVRGAFTGAHDHHRGYFERADENTLFLDELAELAKELQVKLLRALETGSILPLGAEEERHVDVRVIAATNVDIARAPGFRRDLYYRLRGHTLRVPSLDERRSDIPEILDAELGPDWESRFTKAAKADLLQRHYAGNVRELLNLVRAALGEMNDAPIELSLLPAPLEAAEPLSLDGLLPAEGYALSLLETVGTTKRFGAVRRTVLRAAVKTQGSQRKAARFLGLDDSTFARWLHLDPSAC